MAALGGNLAVVKRLTVDASVIDRANFQGGTALRSAAEAGHREIVAHLLSRGARPDALDDFGKRPADYASRRGHTAIVEMLSSAPSVPDRGPHARTLPHDRFANVIRRRSDASINGARAALKNGSRPVDIGCSSLEAPSCVMSLREVLGAELEIGSPEGEAPDPKLPIREVRFLLWKYASTTRPTRLLHAPSASTITRVRALALTPYSEAVWWKRAAGGPSDEAALRELCAAMLHPGTRPSYVEVWDWWFRVQVAAAFLVARSGDAPWPGSLRREVLLDLADGPADWTNEAAIRALVAIARHDESARDDVHDELLRIARRAGGAPAYQHAILPAAGGRIELGGLAPEVRTELEAIVDPDA
jgi:hypothetical protein